MLCVINILNEFGNSIVQQRIDNNTYANYSQKAFAKAYIDGPCDSNTFANRYANYYNEYVFQDMQRNQMPMQQKYSY